MLEDNVFNRCVFQHNFLLTNFNNNMLDKGSSANRGMSKGEKKAIY